MLNARRGSRTQMASGNRRRRVVSVVALDGWEESALMAFAAALARRLDTTDAAPILESARERGIRTPHVDRFQHTSARGVAGVLGERTAVLGSGPLLIEFGLCVDHLGDWAERLRQRGERVMFVAIDGRAAGFVGIADWDA